MSALCLRSVPMPGVAGGIPRKPERPVGLSADVLADLIHQIPTAEAHDLAARVWTALGQPNAAAAARAEARRLGQ